MGNSNSLAEHGDILRKCFQIKFLCLIRVEILVFFVFDLPFFFFFFFSYFSVYNLSRTEGVSLFILIVWVKQRL